MRMRTYVVPGRYRAALAAGVNDLVDQIRQDEFRRAHGHTPIIPDFMIREAPTPDAIVAIDSIVIVADATQPVAAAIEHAKETAREERRRRPA